MIIISNLEIMELLVTISSIILELLVSETIVIVQKLKENNTDCINYFINTLKFC